MARRLTKRDAAEWARRAVDDLFPGDTSMVLGHTGPRSGPPRTVAEVPMGDRTRRFLEAFERAMARRA
jgi:hypothetical protein